MSRRPSPRMTSSNGPNSVGVDASLLSTPPPSSTRKRRRQSPANAVTPEPAGSREVYTDDEGFSDLRVPPAEFRPCATLTTGQCFHWRASSQGGESDVKTSAWGSHNATEWTGTLRTPIGESLVLTLRETPETTLYRIEYAPRELEVCDFLRSYFQLEESLTDLYDKWSERCDRLRQIASCIPGVRIIDQDPWECLVSFICSSNNNIPRITKMLNAIRSEYGQKVVIVNGEDFYSFPSHRHLMEHATEADLREKCGMGYRAKYLHETMKTLDKLGGEQYLKQLRQMEDPNEVQQELLQFTGVGRKVADCVALFSLKQSDAIPVDVHVWNIARRDYDDGGVLQNVKSLTPTVYRNVGDLFRTRFLVKSGWAHSLLFVAELPSFRPALPEALVKDMEQFRDEEKMKGAAKREAKKSKKKVD